MLTQAIDYRNECEALYAILKDLSPSDWNQRTQFKHWTFNDVIRHLHLFDQGAKLTLLDPPAFKTWLGEIIQDMSAGKKSTQIGGEELQACSGPALLARWADCWREVSDAYVNSDPAGRVAWAGPDMSVRSCISARQMETWAHGQALFDALGQVRNEQERIRNIAVMGVNTFGWTFANRRMAVPEIKPHVRLASPDGHLWEWNAPSDSECIEGSAVDFCRVVTQTRNVADTALKISGDVARRWMAMAQCFAGPPEDPPAAGSRCAALR